ncbi:Aldehyde/histidinol dehydrogenase [Fennellomyces sp. T-0311]|nr:Aldehyde/histidinol dehydrogenase [Fennellomyces sp. T-0311]
MADFLSFSSLESIELQAAIVQRHYLTGATRPLENRIELLRGVDKFLAEEEGAIIDALHKDLRRHTLETLVADIAMVRSETQYLIKNLKRLAKPTYTNAGWFSKGNTVIRKEPKGVVCVIGAWNYPVQTSIAPVVAALAAGNTVILKPSEMAPHVAQVMADKLNRYVDPKALCVINEQKLDHIFYTGNGTVGRIIMTAAAKQLASVTLELGGKSPTIILPDAKLDIAANRIAWGKLMNSGQTCIAPDFVVVTESNANAAIEALKGAITSMVGSDPQKSTSLAHIINERHFDRIKGVLDSVPADSILYGGQTDRADLFVAPTIVAVKDIKGFRMMDEEIFGPILPVLIVPDVDAIVPLLRQRDTPLAMYIFGETKKQIESLIDQLPSGGVCINDTLMHASGAGLPFGGQGASGMGSYHGDHGFNELSHHRAVMTLPTKGDGAMKARYMPYTDAKVTLLRIISLGFPPGAFFKTLFALIGAIKNVYFKSSSEKAKTD